MQNTGGPPVPLLCSLRARVSCGQNLGMLKTLLAIVTVILTANNSIHAADNDQTKIPADEQSAGKALKDSPRHGEWVDVPLQGSDAKIHTWVVYPESKEKAPVVLVIHEIFGLTD